MNLDGLDHVALAVTDVRRSAQWYCDVLGLERRHEDLYGDCPAVVAKGDTWVALFPLQGSNPKPPPDKQTIAVRHVAFRAGREAFAAAQRELTERGIAFHFQDHEIAHSIYFVDPDGHELEITTYAL